MAQLGVVCGAVRAAEPSEVGEVECSYHMHQLATFVNKHQAAISHTKTRLDMLERD